MNLPPAKWSATYGRQIFSRIVQPVMGPYNLWCNLIFSDDHSFDHSLKNCTSFYASRAPDRQFFRLVGAFWK